MPQRRNSVSTLAFPELLDLLAWDPGAAGTMGGLLEAVQEQRRRDRGGKGCGSGGSSSDGVRQGKRGPVALCRRTFATVPRRSTEELATSLWVWKRSPDTSQGSATVSMF